MGETQLTRGACAQGVFSPTGSEGLNITDFHSRAGRKCGSEPQGSRLLARCFPISNWFFTKGSEVRKSEWEGWLSASTGHL